MVDNVGLTPGAGALIAADDIGGVLYERVKVTIGPDGVNNGDVSSANPMPVSAASLPLPAGAATGAAQTTGNTSLSSIDGKITAVNTGAVVLAAGTAAVGKLAANSGVDIGDVDVLSLPAVTIGTLPALVAGTANIGDVDVLTMPAVVLAAGVAEIGKLAAGVANIGDVDVLTIAVGTNRIGGTYDVCGQVIDQDGTARTVSRAFANATLIGNTAVVAAQGGSTRIRVLSVTVVALLAVTVKFQSATTDISAGFPFAANGGMAIPHTPHGLFQTAANEALNVNLSLGTTVGVQVTWIPTL